ncbi:MAG: histidine kinase [Gammaproteobacteria bacterium]|nr:MAG: histidine kinase [Gammaproteobacteria bacterium]PHR85034.1 MAG: histidine kinase [Colwellia sp.]
MLKQSRLIFITFFVSIALSIYAVCLLDRYSYQQKHFSIQKVAGSYANHIRNDLNQALSATYPLGALIRTQNGDVSGFTELATEMLSLYPGIASLQLLPDGIIKYIVPMEGNESAIGHNILLSPESTKEAFLARNTGKLTLAGPFDLIQGGMGAVARLPIYLDTGKGQKFWGFSTALIRFPDILNATNLPSLVDSGIGYQLFRIHPDTGEVHVISTSNTLLIDDPEIFVIDIPNGHWTFQVYPINGWRDYSVLFYGGFLGLVFVFFTTLITFLLTRIRLYNLRLEKIVIERTKELQGNLERLAESERRLHYSQESGGIGTWEWNIKTNILFWSEQMSQLIGCTSTQADITYDYFLNAVHPDDREKVVAANNNSIESGAEYNIDYRILWPDGRVRWINGKGNIIRDDSSTAITMLGVAIDITERKLIEDKLLLSSRVFSDTHEGITITDSNKFIVDVNPAFCEITGYSREEVIGKNPRILSSGKQSLEFYVDMWQKVNEDGHWQGEVWNRKKSGEIYAELLTISVLKDDNNNAVNYVGVFTDITSSKRQQEQLSRIAHYDLLTNLPNRVLLADRLSQAMLQCSRHKRSVAVVFLDLDGFKHVNDAYGHDTGDELLIALSVRMKRALREGDSLARIGGDEFVAVLADLTTVEDCEPVLERLLLAASEPVTIDDVVLNVSASIGVTLYPQDSVDADQLMRHADQAMYVAKESGKNRYHLFDTAQDDAVKVQRESLEAIRYALDNHQFVLYYQPKVNMRTGKVTGVEALIRWQHPERGLLNPMEFLPIIENNPMSIEMGEWVIDSALTQISQWQTMGLTLPVSTSVNIAAIQLQQPDFTQRLTALLAAHPDVEPCYLELEVLETSALDDVNHVSAIMNDCMALGVNFALDDFGTGYSSLTYLRRLPASLIKIDQSFVRDMLSDDDDLAIIEGVIALAKSFKRDVIAEGVETIEHGTVLLQLGCDLAQGYGIAKPMPADDIPAWIRDWKPDVSWQV